jgi:hypothetical protein
MGEIRFPWQEPVPSALMELNPERLAEKIDTALNAIETRNAELNGSADSFDERVALQDAFNSLNAVKRVAVREKASGGSTVTSSVHRVEKDTP